MIPGPLADIGSVPDLIIGGAIFLIAVLLALKIAGTLIKLVVFLLIGMGIYVWVS